MKHVWLIGMMGSGKSAVGKILASTWGHAAVDLDKEVERSFGASVDAIFRERGESAFRALEAKAVARAASSKTPSVIATGGGAVLADANVARMRDTGHVVWLEAPVSVLARRVAGSRRPLLAAGSPAKILSKLIAARRPRYARAADLRVDAASGTAAAVARRIADRLKARPIAYRAGDAATAVHVGAGLLGRAGELLREAFPQGTTAVVVTDENVGPLHARRLEKSLRVAGYQVSRTISIRAGERYKNAATVAFLWGEMIAAGIDRSTPVVALGGGVVGDLAGFAAATILRGVPVVQIPTTLVAQVDSAIGGKTGFDLPSGKNLVGAFKQPALVIADPVLLATLPERELRAGMAEVVKYGVIADADFFELLESASWPLSAAMLERIVRRCASLKAGVVERDPHEKGERVVLNFGHTAGHAFEAASGFSVRHGEAVAAGMVAESEWACEQGLCAARDVERLASLLARIGLPTRLAARGAARFLATDKKRIGSTVKVPLLRRIGRVEVRTISIRKLSDVFRTEARRTR